VLVAKIQHKVSTKSAQIQHKIQQTYTIAGILLKKMLEAC
jgi:hypothetical protein